MVGIQGKETGWFKIMVGIQGKDTGWLIIIDWDTRKGNRLVKDNWLGYKGRIQVG